MKRHVQQKCNSSGKDITFSCPYDNCTYIAKHTSGNLNKHIDRVHTGMPTLENVGVLKRKRETLLKNLEKINKEINTREQISSNGCMTTPVYTADGSAAAVTSPAAAPSMAAITGAASVVTGARSSAASTEEPAIERPRDELNL